MSKPVTMGQVADRLEALQESLTRIELDLKLITNEGVVRRIEKLEGTQQWLVRTLGGMVVTILTALIVGYLAVNR